MAITETPVQPATRTYPHVSEITDWKTAQTVRLLWDRIWALEERLQAAQGTVTTLVAGHNANETALVEVGKDVRQAIALSQRPGEVSASATLGGGASGGGDALPGGGDGGGGNIGCQAAGPTGHDSGGLLNPIRAGQIVCGTGHEFSALLNATPDLATRDANAQELVLRMIWHLKQAGFTAGRQKNPSGAISNDKLTVVVDGITRAYDVLGAKGDITQAMSTTMGEVAPPNMVDDAGIPD